VIRKTTGKRGLHVCGIAEWVGYDKHIREKRDTLEAMSVTLARRGPDGHRTVSDASGGAGSLT